MGYVWIWVTGKEQCVHFSESVLEKGQTQTDREVLGLEPPCERALVAEQTPTSPLWHIPKAGLCNSVPRDVLVL